MAKQTKKDKKPVAEKEELTLITAESKTKKKSTFWVVVSAVLKWAVIALSALVVGVSLGSAFLTNNKFWGAWLGIFVFAIVLNNFKKLLSTVIYSFIVGLIFNLVLLYWIFATVQFGTQDQFLSYLSLLGLSAVMSLQFILFGFFYFFLRKLTWVLPFAAASLWVSIEFLHQLIALYLFAFPWFVLGYSQFEISPLIQISSVTGAYGVSFIIVFVCFSAAMLIGAYKKRQKLIYILLSIALLGLDILYGTSEIRTQFDLITTSPKQIRVALMQPNTHGLILMGHREEVLNSLNKQLLALKDKEVEFIVWPETSFDGSFTDPENQKFIKLMK